MLTRTLTMRLPWVNIAPLILHPDKASLFQVRAACGFACVRCGATVYEYCAVTPAPDGANQAITLLCPPCHALLSGVLGGQPAAATILAHPIARQAEFDRSRLPFVSGTSLPLVDILADVQMRDVPVPIHFGGFPVIELLPPEVPGGPVQLSVYLGREGQRPAEIVARNEWRPPDDTWQFDGRGGRYVIASAAHDLRLVLAIPGPGRLRIEALRSWSGGRLLEIDRHQATLDGRPVMLRSCRAVLIGTTL